MAGVYEGCAEAGPAEIVLDTLPADPGSASNLLLDTLHERGRQLNRNDPLFRGSLRGEPGTVWIGAGTFTIGGTIPLAAGQRLRGVGRMSTILRAVGGGVLVTMTDGPGCALSDLTLCGWRAGTGIAVASAGALIESVRVHGFATGIVVEGGEPGPDFDARGPEGMVLDQVSTRGCRVALAIGRAGHAIRLSGCDLEADERVLTFAGNGLDAVGCRFARQPMVGVALPLVRLGGRGARLRYCVFEAEAPSSHVELRAGPGTPQGHAVEHCLHRGGLPGSADPVVSDVAQPGSALTTAPRSGASAWNLLCNGSFEWWGREPDRSPAGWTLEAPDGSSWSPVELEYGAEMPRADARYPAEAEVVESPPARDGGRAARVIVPATNGPGTTLRGRALEVGDRGLGSDAVITFSMWVKRPPETSVESRDGVPVPGRVRLRLVNGANVVESAPDRQDLAGAWQRLCCVAPCRPGRLPIPEVRIEGDNEAETIVFLDGGQLTRGHLIPEAVSAPVCDEGGEVLGPLRLAEGLLQRARLRVLPDEAADAAEVVSVPAAARLEAVELAGTAERVEITVEGRLAAVVAVDGWHRWIAPEAVPVPAGGLVGVRVSTPGQAAGGQPAVDKEGEKSQVPAPDAPPQTAIDAELHLRVAELGHFEGPPW